MTALALRGLVRTYAGRPPVPALRGVDLDAPSGTLTAVLGPSGCGKTTLLRLIAGFDRPDAGTIVFDRDVVSRPDRVLPPERRRVGIVPQEGALFPHLDVAGNVGFGLRPGRSRAAGRDRVAEVLDLVGLAGYQRRRPHELSGGQQQRVALARALAPEPALILLDEPFTALDAGLRGALRSEVSATLAAAGATALLVTHDQGEALAMADHLAVMRAGRIVQAGPPEDVYRQPIDADTARFLGDAVFLPGQMSPDGASVTCALGRIPVAPRSGTPPADPGPGRSAVACLRPEQLTRSDPSPVRATVERIHYHGHDALVEMRVAGLLVLARWVSLDLPRPGDEIGLGVVGPAVTFPDGPVPPPGASPDLSAAAPPELRPTP